MPTICVFDTETTSLEKPFCYNVGYTIFNNDEPIELVNRDFVVEQIWYNTPLFSTAYYAEKRQLYVAAMRSRKASLEKWGYIMQTMIRDFKKFNVKYAYAYNSPFDDKVFTFNNEWYHTINPLDTIPILDIRGPVSEYVTNTQDFKDFCEEHSCFTDTGNYSGTAETVYKYLTHNPQFIEAHTALSDSQIEAEILMNCLNFGAEIGKEYNVQRVLARPQAKPFKIMIDKDTIYEGEYLKKNVRNDVYSFTTNKRKGK